MKKYSERIPIPILQKILQSVLLSGDGGGRGDLKEVIFYICLVLWWYLLYACSGSDTNL